jgi:hypothetical protein
MSPPAIAFIDSASAAAPAIAVIIVFMSALPYFCIE